MTMSSTALLPALRELPTTESRERMSFQGMMTGLVGTDRAAFAAEFASAVSVSLWGVFDRVNVNDNLSAAYEAQYPLESDAQSLHGQWQEMAERGPESVQGFVNALKGKVAEFHTKDLLEDRGYTNVELASAANQEGWDITAIDPSGEAVLIQVKTGTSLSVGEVQHLMEENPDYSFAFSTEIHDKIVESSMDTDSIIDIGFDYERVEGIEDGLETLSANEGIDIPDGVVDIVPYAAAIVGGVRLIYGALKTEREFQAADRTTKNRIQVVQTLTLMSRMGVSTVLATAGGMGGASTGSLVPGVGNVIGGVGGTVIGAGVGMYLNKHLQPHMLDIALDVTGLTHDDLFYYKNKLRIDEVGFKFQTRAKELAAIPGI